MEDSNKDHKKEHSGDGTDYLKHQQAVDRGINERLKKEQGTEKLDPERVNSVKPEHKPDVSQKKSGRTAH